VLKTRRFGYDGKGQFLIDSPARVDAAWAALAALSGGAKPQPLLLEAFVPFTRELSIVGARSRGGDVVFYPVVENEHRDGILYLTQAPAPVTVGWISGAGLPCLCGAGAMPI
jgi:5-(carboxyamino)imidazole ribonucleotide synthase